MEVEGCGPSLPAACSAGSQILQMRLIFPFSSLPRALGATWSWLGPGGDQEAVGGDLPSQILHAKLQKAPCSSLAPASPSTSLAPLGMEGLGAASRQPLSSPTLPPQRG